MGTAQSSVPSSETKEVIVVESTTKIPDFLKQNENKPMIVIPVPNIEFPELINQEENTEIINKFNRIYSVRFREHLSKAQQHLQHGFVWFALPKDDCDKYFERLSTVFIGKCAEENLPYDGKHLKVGTIAKPDRVYICVFVSPEEETA